MKLTRIFALVAIAVMAVSCYETYESVAPRKVYDDEAFEAQFPEAQHITIAELKYAFGTISNTGVNSGWGNTKSMLIIKTILTISCQYHSHTVFNSYILISIAMKLHSNVLSSIYRHKSRLQIFAGPNTFSIIIIFARYFTYIGNINLTTVLIFAFQLAVITDIM